MREEEENKGNNGKGRWKVKEGWGNV